MIPGRSIFVDTSFVYAIINPRDQWHGSAVKWRDRLIGSRRSYVTTEFVLTEIADGLSSLEFRNAAKLAIDVLVSDPDTEIVALSSDLFKRAFFLYESRPDKTWGLTDCSSFVVMRELGITDALTTDDHFRQAGFRVLMHE